MTEVADVRGEDRLEGLTLRDRTTGAGEDLEAGGLFVLIGAVPHTDWLPDELERDKWGYLVTGADLDPAPPDVRDERAGHLRRRRPPPPVREARRLSSR